MPRGTRGRPTTYYTPLGKPVHLARCTEVSEGAVSLLPLLLSVLYCLYSLTVLYCTVSVLHCLALLCGVVCAERGAELGAGERAGGVKGAPRDGAGAGRGAQRARGGAGGGHGGRRGAVPRQVNLLVNQVQHCPVPGAGTVLCHHTVIQCVVQCSVILNPGCALPSLVAVAPQTHACMCSKENGKKHLLIFSLNTSWTGAWVCLGFAWGVIQVDPSKWPEGYRICLFLPALRPGRPAEPRGAPKNLTCHYMIHHCTVLYGTPAHSSVHIDCSNHLAIVMCVHYYFYVHSYAFTLPGYKVCDTLLELKQA